MMCVVQFSSQCVETSSGQQPSQSNNTMRAQSKKRLASVCAGKQKAKQDKRSVGKRESGKQQKTSCSS